MNEMCSTDCPLLVENDSSLKTSIKVLDHTYATTCHKIGVLFADEKQNEEWDIYSNEYGTLEYDEFLNQLGEFYDVNYLEYKIIILCSNPIYYSGGVKKSSCDGKLALIHKVISSEILYHVSTLFPTNHKVFFT